MNLLLNTQVTKVLEAAGAGTSAAPSDPVDMTGFEGVAFLASLGTAAANNTLKVQQSNDSGGSPDDWTDLEGSLVASGSGITDLAVEIYRPTKRFLRANVTRGTSTTVEAIWAVQYGTRVAAVDNNTDVQAVKVLATPAEGTA